MGTHPIAAPQDPILQTFESRPAETGTPLSALVCTFSRRNRYGAQGVPGMSTWLGEVQAGLTRRNRYACLNGALLTYTLSVSASFFWMADVQWKLGNASIRRPAPIDAETGTDAAAPLRNRLAEIGTHAEVLAHRQANAESGTPQKQVRRGKSAAVFLLRAELGTVSGHLPQKWVRCRR